MQQLTRSKTCFERRLWFEVSFYLFLINIGKIRAQELCESRGGRPGLPVPNKPNGFCGRKATLKQNSGAV